MYPDENSFSFQKKLGQGGCTEPDLTVTVSKKQEEQLK